MRNRTLLAVLVLSAASLPAGLTAQRLPRPGRRTAPAPAPLPPEIAPVSKALAYRRSHWSAEGYTMLSSIGVPVPGGTAGYTAFGSGVRGDYRLTEHFSFTSDVTTSFFTGPSAETIELGGRYSPMGWDHRLRPFFDVRASYLRLYDSFNAPLGVAAVGDPAGEFVEEGRYSHGMGGVTGLGFVYSMTPSFSVLSEVLGVRARMTAYRMNGPADIPVGNNYWMTSFRYILGIRFNPAQLINAIQNPRQ
jgi:hypothetical protein